MVIRITNKCLMGCLHCMEESNPNGDHMSIDTFQNALSFALKCNTTQGVVMISGGEPFEHPTLMSFLKLALIRLSERTVYLATNGVALKDKKLCVALLELFKIYPWFNIQITAIAGLYPKYKDGIAGCQTFMETAISMDVNLFNRVNLVTELVHGVIPIGRAKTSTASVVKDQLDFTRKGTSCFNLYSALIGNGKPYNLIHAIKLVKANVKAASCKPLIKENGDISLGEYEACSIVGNVNTISDDGVIELDSSSSPCLKCITNETQLMFMKQHIFSKLKI